MIQGMLKVMALDEAPWMEFFYKQMLRLKRAKSVEKQIGKK
jgi:hypothetical protein